MKKIILFLILALPLFSVTIEQTQLNVSQKEIIVAHDHPIFPPVGAIKL